MSKHIPLRKCVGCNEMKPKGELIRIVKNDDGISLDTTGKANGRGAYICPCEECLNLAQKNKRLERAFSCKVDASVYEHLGKELTLQNE